MKRGGLKIAIAVILILLAAVLSIKPLQSQLNLGLDLRGGAEVVLQAIPEDGTTVTTEDMEQLKEIMRKRVDAIGVSEPVIQLEGNDRIIIELAGVEDPDQAIEALGQTAKLEFRDSAGTLLLSGSDLKNAQGVSDNKGGGLISLEFTSEGAKKFGDATLRLVGQPIIIYLDGEVLINANVKEPILDGKAQIEGTYTLEEAILQAAILRGGALPIDVEVMAKRTVGPSLGSDSLQKSLYAGIIGMILLLIFIIAYYRLPGVIAAFSLIAYTVALFWIIAAVGVVLTLPGIAGFVLSIGMAVDANIIIYERVREELNNGKSLRAAISAGFKRATWTIVDSDVTTLLAAAVLFKFGTGSIQGFAVTLSIGIVLSMLTALVLTRYLLFWSADVSAFKKHIGLYVTGGAKNA